MTTQKSSILLPKILQVRLSVRMQGILWFIASGFISTLINSLMRILSGDMGYHPMQLVFFYSIMGAATYLPLILSQRQAFQGVHMRLYYVRSLLEVGGFTFSFYALTLIPFAMFTTMMFTIPLIGAIAAVWFLGETMSTHKWIGLALGFVGITVVAQPNIYNIHPELLLPLAASLCFALCGVCIRKMAMRNEPPTRIAFITLSCMAIITLPMALAHWQTPSISHIPYLIGLAILSGAVQFSVGNALKNIRLTTAQPLTFLNLLWSSVLGWMIFGENVAIATVIGGLFIVAGILISLKRLPQAQVALAD